jgi:hypothetical protein
MAFAMLASPFAAVCYNLAEDEPEPYTGLSIAGIILQGFTSHSGIQSYKLKTHSKNTISP